MTNESECHQQSRKRSLAGLWVSGSLPSPLPWAGSGVQGQPKTHHSCVPPQGHRGLDMSQQDWVPSVPKQFCFSSTWFPSLHKWLHPHNIIFLLLIQQFCFYLFHLFTNEFESRISKLGWLDKKPETARQVGGPMSGYSLKTIPSKHWEPAYRGRPCIGRVEHEVVRWAGLSLPSIVWANSTLAQTSFCYSTTTLFRKKLYLAGWFRVQVTETLLHVGLIMRIFISSSDRKSRDRWSSGLVESV